ncbi:MAG: glycosyltransferase [Actinobacteria bacterium]|nr:glycosyltransferase [Actinomycetota bacterium]
MTSQPDSRTDLRRQHTNIALSVIIPARNAASTIAQQLDALLVQEWHRPFEVLVVDNASTDATREVVQRYLAPHSIVRLIEASESTGVAYCRNAGIAAARGAAIAICDADDVVAPGWVRAIGDALEDHRLVSGRLDVHELNPDWLIASRGGVRRAHFRFGGLFAFANGGNMGVRAEIVEECGGFDQRFVPAEDIEWSFRLWQSGIRVHYVDDALIHYRLRESLSGMWRQAYASGRIRLSLVKAVTSAGYQVEPDGEWRRWAWLFRNLPTLRSKAGRARWTVVAGGRAGRLAGRLASVVGRDLVRSGDLPAKARVERARSEDSHPGPGPVSILLGENLAGSPSGAEPAPADHADEADRQRTRTEPKPP